MKIMDSVKTNDRNIESILKAVTRRLRREDSEKRYAARAAREEQQEKREMRVSA
jgi:hypothetical protein